jgi:hypothetical protein
MRQRKKSEALNSERKIARLDGAWRLCRIAI